MIRSLIIDDSQSSIETLSELIEKYLPQVELLDYAEDIYTGINKINMLNPDLVFLDIAINDKTGFDLLNSTPNKNFEVVFVTGHSEYAIKAFEHNALHYLIKPVSPIDLVEAVNRLNINNNGNVSRKLKSVSDFDIPKYNSERKIAFNTEQEKKIVYLRDIQYIEGERRYSKVHLISGEHIFISINLKKLEKQFISDEFYRISKSYIVNLNHISSIKHIDGGIIVMDNGANISIPRRKRDEFSIRLSNYLK